MIILKPKKQIANFKQPLILPVFNQPFYSILNNPTTHQN